MTHGVTYDDVVALRRPSSLEMSADGARVAFVLKEWDRRTDHFSSHVYVLDVPQTKTSRATNRLADESLPRWSPDGKSLAFLSN